MDNTDIWKFAEETDPSGTKTAKLEGRDVTSINGTYIAKKATELFGPIGIGWGYEIEEERYDPAGPIFDKETKATLCEALNHTIKIRFWYEYEGKRGEITEFGHTKYIYATKYGFTADPEAPKKSLTDAIKKSLSFLGFSADIYLGQFDSHEYVDAQRNREALYKAENFAEEKTKQEMDRKKWIEDTTRLMRESKVMSMLEGIFKKETRVALARKDTEAQLEFVKVKDEMVKKIGGKK